MASRTKHRHRSPSRRPTKSWPAGRTARRSNEPSDASTADVAATERLQKVLAAAGVAGRRECEELIREGRVEVDREVVTELGTKVDPRQQEIRVDGEVLSRPKLVYFAVHKPTGVVSTSRDQAGRPRVIDLLPSDLPRLFCVGRLDMASEGLILVTNDGELANGLTHPRHGVEKVYHVQVAGRVEVDELKLLRRGVHLAEGFARVKVVRIKSHRRRSTVLEMILDEGRNREVRRLLARIGHKVQKLTRVAVGPVRLGELPSGAVRPLSRQEVTALRRAVAAGRRPTEDHRPRPPKPRRKPSRHRGQPR